MNKIIDAALAVVERWDSPRWAADSVHTSELIQALRESIREYDLGCEQNTHQSDEYELCGKNPRKGAGMTREEIIRLAREAGFDDFFTKDLSLERFAALVAAAEREACAVLVETVRGENPDLSELYIAAEIRARGKNE